MPVYELLRTTMADFTVSQEGRRSHLTSIKPHPTQPVNIRGRLIDIDLDMIPVVEWLNSIHGVRTLYCCQGDIRKAPFTDGGHPPYILLRCWSLDSIGTICRILTEFSEAHGPSEYIRTHYHTVKLELDWLDSEIRLKCEWHDNLALQDFNRFLENYDTY